MTSADKRAAKGGYVGAQNLTNNAAELHAVVEALLLLISQLDEEFPLISPSARRLCSMRTTGTQCIRFTVVREAANTPLLRSPCYTCGRERAWYMTSASCGCGATSRMLEATWRTGTLRMVQKKTKMHAWAGRDLRVGASMNTGQTFHHIAGGSSAARDILDGEERDDHPPTFKTR